MEIIKGFPTSYRRKFTKTITFTGAAGAGAVGTVVVMTASGRVNLLDNSVYCTTNLGEAAPTATVALGITGQTTLINGATNAVNIDVGEFWSGTNAVASGTRSPMGNSSQTPGLSLASGAQIIITVAAQDVTSGVLEVTFFYEEITAGARLT